MKSHPFLYLLDSQVDHIWGCTIIISLTLLPHFSQFLTHLFLQFSEENKIVIEKKARQSIRCKARLGTLTQGKRSQGMNGKALEAKKHERKAWQGQKMH